MLEYFKIDHLLSRVIVKKYKKLKILFNIQSIKEALKRRNYIYNLTNPGREGHQTKQFPDIFLLKCSEC